MRRSLNAANLFGFALMLMLPFFVGCTSLKNKANDLYEAKAYEEALRIYDKILTSSPQDADALIGRMKSREKLIEKKLIDVRIARMAENPERALETLKEVYSKEREWAYSPKDGAVAYTQEEETNEALKYVSKQIEAALSAQFPVRAAWVAKNTSLLFQGNAQKKWQKMNDEIGKVGLAKCKKFSSAKSPKTPHFNSFVDLFCKHWGTESRTVAGESETLLKELYGKITVGLFIDGLPDEHLATYQNVLIDSFQRSPWFDQKSPRSLELKVSGRYLREAQSNPVRKVHQFFVDVPYTEYVPVMRNKQVPYSATESQCVSQPNAGNVCRNVSVTKYRTESYWTNEPVTKFRKEPRNQEYTATQVSQLLALNLKSEFTLLRDRNLFDYSERLEQSDHFHDWNMPQIGLTPKAANLAEPLSWLKAEADKLSKKFATEIFSDWEKRFCRRNERVASIANEGEAVFKCARIRLESEPDFVKRWNQDVLGVTLSQAREVLNLDSPLSPR